MVDATNPFADLVPTAEASPPAEANPFADLVPKKPAGPSAGGAFVRGAAEGAVPAAGGMIGAGAGAAAGAALGSVVPIIGTGIGAVAGGIGGALLGSYGGSAAQEAVIQHALPESTKKAINESRAADEAAHPYARFAGNLAPGLATLKPWGTAATVAPEGASAITRAMASPATAHVMGAGMMGGLEAGQQAAGDQPMDWTKVGLATGAGGLMAHQTRLGEKLTDIGATPISRITGIPNPGAAATSTPEPGLAAGQRRAVEAPTLEPAPENAPAINSVVGLRRGDAEPERLTVLGYIDQGRGVQLQREDGSVTHEATGDFVKNLAAPPAAEDVTRTPPRTIEGEPIGLDDFPNAFGEDTDTSALRARAAGTTPERAVERSARSQQRVDEANNPLPGMSLTGLDLADRAERSAQALLRMGRTEEAEAQMVAAQRWRQIHGAGPGEFIGPEGAAAAAQARATANQPEILGQRTPPVRNVPLSKEEATAMEADARAERAARVATGERQPTQMSAVLEGAAPNTAMPLSPDDLAFLRAYDEAGRPFGTKRLELTGQAPNEPLVLTPEQMAALEVNRARKPQRRQGQGSFAGDLAADMAGQSASSPMTMTAPPEFAPSPDSGSTALQSGTRDAEQARPSAAISEENQAAPLTPSPAEARDEIPHTSLRGAEDQAIVPSSGRAFPVEYSIVSARDLITSHHDDLSPNPRYPQALQPRSRERAETEAQLRSILNGGAEGEFRPELLGENPDAANGSPVIGPEGYVESGNARSMALRRAYERGMPQATEYRDFLAGQGYPIEGIDDPVLVRINRAAMEMPQREQLARDLNAPPQAAMSASDQAMADARQIPPDLLRGYRGGDVFSVENQPFVRSVLASVARPTDLPALTDPAGGLSRAGQQRVQAALLAKAYGDTGLVASLTEDADNNIKSIGSAMTDAAPTWARLRDSVANGSVPAEFDLTSPLLESVRLIAHARETGRNMAEFMAQRGLFGDDVPPETRAVLDWMLGAPDWTRRYGRAKIADAMVEYAESVQRPEGLIPGVEARGEPLEMAARAKQVAQGASGDLFAAPVDSAQGATGVRPRLAEDRGETSGSADDRVGEGAPTGGESRVDEPNVSRETELTRSATKKVDPFEQIPLTDEQLNDMHGFESRAYDPELVHDFWDQFPDTLTGMHEGARSWVVTRGAEDGNEHVVVIDPDTGKVEHLGTNGVSGTVAVPGDIANSDIPYVVHHNHPGGYALSVDDLMAMAYPGIGRVLAHTGYGDVFDAALSGNARDWVMNHGDPAESGVAIKYIQQGAAKIVDARLKAQIAAGNIEPLDAEMLGHDLIARALDGARLIDYTSTLPLGSLPNNVVRSILFNAGEAAAARGRQVGLRLNYGDSLNGRLSDRSTHVVQPDEAMARLSGADAEIAPGQLAGQIGDSGRGEGVSLARQGDQAVVEARPDTTRGPALAEEERLTPERRPFVPPGTDYLDNVSSEIATQTGAEGPGTYARAATLPPREARGRIGTFFNAINQAFTTPMGLARMDWRSSQKWRAEEAMRQEATGLRNSYRQMLPTFLSATPEELAAVNKMREWRRLKGLPGPDDGRASVMVNDGSVPSALSKPGERVYLDNDRLIGIDRELTQTFQKAWDNVISGTAQKFGWHGEPTSAAIQEAAAAGGSSRERNMWNRTAALIGAMEEQRRAGYTPLMRFGDYYFAVTPKAGTEAAKAGGWEGDGFPPVANFQLMDSHSPWEKAIGGRYVEGETPKQAQQRLDTLRQQFPEDQYNIEHGYMFAKENALRDLNLPAVEKLFVLVGNDVRQQIRDQAALSPDPASVRRIGQQTNDLYNRIRDGILDQMYKDMQAGFKKRANQTPGYDPDLTRSAATYLNWTGQHAADLLHRDNIENINENIIVKHPDPQVRDYWRQWDERNEDSRTALDEGLRRVRQASFYYALGANAATTAKILTHGPLLGVPTLSTGLGAQGRVQAVGTYLNAMRQTLAGVRADTATGLHLDWRSMRGISADERAMLGKLEDENRLHAQGADELAAIRRSGEEALTPQAKFNRRLLDLWASNVSVADQMTRVGMALAAYRTASRPGALDKFARTWRNDNVFQELGNGTPKPEDIARFMIDRTTGVWGDANRMPALRNRYGAMVGQFRNYELNYLSTMHQLMRTMGPEGKVSAAMMLGGLFALGGATAWPFVGDLKNAAESGYKALTSIDPDIDKSLASAMGSTGQDHIAETVLHGFSRNWLGIDLGQGVGFGDLISRQMQSGLNLAGPAAGIFGGDVYHSWQRYNNDQPPSAWMSELLPNAAKNAVRAYVVEPEQGLASARSGTRVIAPADITPAMQAKTALGFQPTEVARAYEDEQTAFHMRSARTAAMGALENRIATLQARALDADKNDPTNATMLRAQAQNEIKDAVTRGILPADEIQKFNHAIRLRIQGAEHPELRRLREVPKSERGNFLQQQEARP